MREWITHHKIASALIAWLAFLVVFIKWWSVNANVTSEDWSQPQE